MKLKLSNKRTENDEQFLTLVATRTLEPGDCWYSGYYLAKNKMLKRDYQIIHVNLVDNYTPECYVSPRTVPVRLDAVEIMCGPESVELLKDINLLSVSAFEQLSTAGDQLGVEYIWREAFRPHTGHADGASKTNRVAPVVN